jgi:hypothetical protein
MIAVFGTPIPEEDDIEFTVSLQTESQLPYLSILLCLDTSDGHFDRNPSWALYTQGPSDPAGH